MRIALILTFLSLPVAAHAEDAIYRFTWQGAGGYAFDGAMSFDASKLGGGRIHEGDVQCFVIEGRRGEVPVGRWALGMLIPETTWLLTFDTGVEEFVTYGLGDPMPQAWNMDGYGTDCGEGGFGFNIGNYAQDICIGGTLIADSQMPPVAPFPAERVDTYDFPVDGCRPSMLLSELRLK
ncbi:MAG: hypothetical protein VX874_10080 [Pseudomonadota bacterium]|nr:hypothetical protein [Pseudomonadota bacterium]